MCAIGNLLYFLRNLCSKRNMYINKNILIHSYEQFGKEDENVTNKQTKKKNILRIFVETYLWTYVYVNDVVNILTVVVYVFDWILWLYTYMHVLVCLCIFIYEFLLKYSFGTLSEIFIFDFLFSNFEYSS